LVLSGDFTLGKDVQAFENAFAELCGMPYAVGVGSGTDALDFRSRCSVLAPVMK
jgi:dTDP-4-amino-4,6-dideoxygalactose transaminase